MCEEMNNTIAIDFLTKCRIYLIGSNCINIATILLIIAVVGVLFLVLFFIVPYMNNQSSEVKE